MPPLWLEGQRAHFISPAFVQRTMSPSVEASCGGHITLLFAIDKSARLKRSQGSRGTGFTINHGVLISLTLHTDEALAPKRTMVGMEPDASSPRRSNERSTVTVVDADGGARSETALYMDYIQACRNATLLREHEYIDVQVTLQCPTSQGFGMSAAGLVALGRAVHAATRRGSAVQYEKLAHRIEREHGAGLGDVLGLSVGGVELRIEPGAPGWPGQAVSFGLEAPLLLVWDAAEARHTSLYIDDPDWQNLITKAGEASLATLRTGAWNAGRWSEVLNESRNFADASGMLAEAERAAVYDAVVEEVGQLGLQATCAVRLCMLGSSVVVLPRRVDELPTEEDLLRLESELNRRGLGTLLSAFAPTTRRH